MKPNQKIEEKIRLITRNTEEVLTTEDLRQLIASGTKLRHYIGLEISGMVHLGTGLMCMGKVADFLAAGAECQIFLADWHTYINDKLGGDWQIIKKVARTYFQEALIASLKCFGVKGGKVKFLLASDVYQNSIHWQNLMEVSKHTTLSRVKRSLDIAGREAGESVDFAKLIYPPLQVADIFTLQVNLVHAGMDQRKAHVIARKVAKQLRISPLRNRQGKIIAPIAIHNPLLYGLQKPPVWPITKLTRKMKISLKMTKSNPSSCIFVHDSPEAIRQKIQRAFCPPKETNYNPIINWAKLLIFSEEGRGELKAVRPAKFGGTKTYYQFKDLVTDYQTGQLHPLDLKTAVAKWLIAKLEPARKHFQSNKVANEGLKFLEKITKND